MREEREEKFIGGGSIADENEEMMTGGLRLFGCLFFAGVALLVAVVGVLLWVMIK